MSLRTSWAGGGRGVAWPVGLVVAVAAGVATAHGLYEVAAAAPVPPPIAGLYPVITDGLALVAYATTGRLNRGGRAYAWAVVVLAAGLSGVAQAAYLAGGVAGSTALRFGVGAWPAVAVAIVAHLLHLLHQATTNQPAQPAQAAPVQPAAVHAEAVQPQAVQAEPVQPAPVHAEAVQWTSVPGVHAVQPWPSNRDLSTAEPTDAGLPSAAGDRARQVAARYRQAHGRLPTTSELALAAEVARGTAGNVLKALRAEGPALHAIHDDDQSEPDGTTYP